MNDTQITMPGFEPPTPADTIAAIKRQLAEHAAAEADPLNRLQDLMTAVEEMQLMMERGSRPAAILIAAKAARRIALDLEAKTDDEAFFKIAESLKSIVNELKADDEQEVQDPTHTVRSVVFTPDTTDPTTGERIPGQEFILPDEIAAYKKASPTAAAEWERTHPQPTQADIVKSNIGRVSFTMDALKDPGEALLHYDAIPTGYYRRYTAAHFARLVQEVSRRTGADPQQIADKDKRTPEQQQMLYEIAAREQAARLDAFMNSNYMQAASALDPLHGAFEESQDAAEGRTPGVKEQAILYFFATHEAVKITGKAELTEDHIAELTRIYTRLDAFYKDRQAPGTDPTPETLYAFIDQENPDPNAAKEILQNLPLIQGLRTKSHNMLNNKLTNALQTGGLINRDEGTYLIVQKEDKAKRQKEITSYTMISYDPGETGITVKNANLTEYERQVSDAVISLWIEADRKKAPPYFTAETIFKAMPGGSDQPSAQQKGAITKALDKFSRLRITVDATEEARARGWINDKARYEFSEPYLAYRLHTVRVKNGATVQAYQILSQPVMLTYCQMTKQILTVPAKYIAVEKVKSGRPSGELIPMTATRQAMTGYIVRRIKIIKYNIEKAQEKKRSYDIRRSRHPELQLPQRTVDSFRETGDNNTISFATMFELCGIATQDRDRAMENRKFCFDVLDYQIAVGNISGYKKKTAGRSITGIEITP